MFRSWESYLECSISHTLRQKKMKMTSSQSFLTSDLLNISMIIDPRKIEQYHRLLRRVLPDKSSLSPSDDEAQLQAMKDAFHQEDRGRDTAKMVHDQIVKFFNDYNTGGYLSPYTSLIGPCGIGKSFLVKQMAYQNRNYILCQSGNSGRSLLSRALSHRRLDQFNP